MYLVEQASRRDRIGPPITERPGNDLESAADHGSRGISCGSVQPGRSVWRQRDERRSSIHKAEVQPSHGKRTAEEIKSDWLGLPLDEKSPWRSRAATRRGVPKTLVVSDEEIREALAETVSVIIEAVRVALEQTPPELSADIVDRGIVLTGGGSLLKNLDKRLREETGLPVSMADDPLASVALGT